MARNKQREPVWSPYGHEAARRELLALRRMQIIIGAIVVAILYAVFLQLTLDVEDPNLGGNQELEIPEQKPITVTVSPGRMAEFVDGTKEAPQGQAAPGRLEPPVPNKIFALIQPFLTMLAPLVAAFWLLSRVGTSARGKLAELNLGVYKGAMPYEMHTARAYKQVFTYRQVDAHVFGKVREDFLFGSYLGSPPLAVRLLLGEDIEAAKVTGLHRGGAPRVTIRTAPTPRNPLERALAPLRHLLARHTQRRDPRADRLRRLRRQSRV